MTDEQIIEQHKKDKSISVDFKARRFVQWNENYFLYRDKIITNRLTQRQPVNIPIMRETIQTWISKIDEPPMLNFEARSKGNQSQDGEILVNELWAYDFERLKLDLLDNLEKKVVGLQGRGFKSWGWADNAVFCDVVDPYDIEISPNCNPLDLNTASSVIRKNIFKPLREILANDKYSDDAKNILKIYLDSKEGLIKSQDSREEWFRRQERLRTLGAVNFDMIGATDIIVELNENYKMMWDSKLNKYVRHKLIIAADIGVLSKKTLNEATGLTKIPIISWADDPDLNDIWCDGKGDNVRTFNKVVNTYISQDLENRTFRNFGMYFFNTLNNTFSPKAFDPKPFGMYGVPGNPDEIVKQMRIEPLNDTAQQITFLKDLIQSSVAQTPTERGVDTSTQKTLGEIKLNLQQSTGRNEVTAKNYRRAWKESGEIWYELYKENSNGNITLYKKGPDGNYNSTTITAKDFINPNGYECKVVFRAEKEAADNLQIQKIGYIQQNFQNNPVALRLAKRKQLEVLGWTPDEIEQVMQFEEQPTPAMTVVDPANPNPAQPIPAMPLQ